MGVVQGGHTRDTSIKATRRKGIIQPDARFVKKSKAVVSNTRNSR